MSGLAIGVTCAVVYLHWGVDEATTQCLSPNEIYRVSLVESQKLPFKIDRNFKVCLDILSDDSKRETLFISPDEGMPIGSDRFIWSKDSTYVLLVGKHFFVATDIQTGPGEQAYFLYHLPSKESWVNSNQVIGSHKNLTGEQLRGIDFVPPIFISKPANGTK